MSRSDITESIQNAFISNYAAFETAIYEKWPDATYQDAEKIMAELAAELFQNNKSLIYAAVERSLFGCPGEDWSQEPADHAQNVFVHLLENKHKLTGLVFPEKAKPTTLLFALVRSRMRAVRSQLSNRQRIISSRLADFNSTVREIADPPDPVEQKEEKLLAA